MKSISNVPMSSAPFVYDQTGNVAWDKMWKDFCYLAIEGGPPHRDIPLKSKKNIPEHSENYQAAVKEILRAYSLLILYKVKEYKTGWIQIHLHTTKMSQWYAAIINSENVECVSQGRYIFLPVNDDFRLEKEIKNVVTVVAKAYHYWRNHRTLQEKFLIATFGYDLKL